MDAADAAHRADRTPLRVLTIGNLYPPAAAGGYERIFRDCVRALRDAGHAVTILTTAPVPGAEVDHEVDEGVVRSLRWYWRDFGWPRVGPRERLAIERANRDALRRELQRVRPDVVGFWQLGGLPLSVLEHVRRAGVPAVGLVGDAWMVYGTRHDRWTAVWRGRPRAAAVVERVSGLPARLRVAQGARWLFISEYLQRICEAEHGALPDSGLLRPGVDPARFAFAPERPWAGRLLYAGRVEEAKGVHTAIEALAELPASVTLTIDGPAHEDYAARLRELARERGVEGRVRWQRSASDEVARAYADHDAVVFPVLWDEPWGLVPLEAMAVGRPVLATGTGGSAEFLDDGRNCLLFAPGDAGALAAAVRRLAEGPGLVASLRAAGRATAERFTSTAFERGYVAEVEAVAARGRAREAGAPGVG